MPKVGKLHLVPDPFFGSSNPHYRDISQDSGTGYSSNVSVSLPLKRDVVGSNPGTPNVKVMEVVPTNWDWFPALALPALPVTTSSTGWHQLCLFVMVVLSAHFTGLLVENLCR